MPRLTTLGSAALALLLGFAVTATPAQAAPRSAPPSSSPQVSAPPSVAPEPVPSLPAGYTVSISAPTTTRVGQTIVLRADTSELLPGASYAWDLGDGSSAQGPEVTHLYTTAGSFTVTLRHAQAGGGGEQLVVRQTITAFRHSLLLFVPPLGDDATHRLEAQALEVGTALTVLPVMGHTALLQQESLEQLLASHRSDAGEADLLVFALDQDVSLSALVGAAQSGAGQAERGATLLLLTEGTPEPASRLARLVVELLHPARVLLAPRAALDDVVRTPDPTAVDAALRELGSPVSQVDASTPGPPRWALLSQLVDELLRRGTRSQSLLLLLLVPLVVLLIVFLRQVVGLSTMGLFVPVVMALSYVLMGTVTGLVASLGIIVAGVAVRWLLKKVRLLYLGRVGLATSMVVFLLLLAMLPVALLAPQLLPDLATFPLLVLALITERTYSVIAERGIKPALLIFAETTVVALLTAIVAGEWIWLRTLLFAWPELTLLFLVAQLVVGRYTGLRATELLRFRDLLNEVEYAEEE